MDTQSLRRASTSERRPALRFSLYEVGAGVIIALATLLRLLLLLQGWPSIDSNEGTTGVLALHIAYQNAHPLVSYGPHATGTLEAYLVALAFHLFGPSPLTLHLAVLPLFVVFLVSMYLLTSLLFGRKYALLTLALLGPGSSEMIQLQVQVTDNYQEMLCFISLLLLLTCWLALSSRQGTHIILNVRRPLLYGLWSLLAGLSIWSNPLIFPFILICALFLFIFCRSELRPFTISLLLAGFLIGLSPLIIHSIRHREQPLPPTTLHNSVLYNDATTSLSSRTSSIINTGIDGQIAGTLLVSLPIATGANAMCRLQDTDAWPLTYIEDQRTFQCSFIHGIWGSSYIILLYFAMITAIKRYWYHWQRWALPFAKHVSWKLWRRAPAPAQPLYARYTTIVHAARLLITCGAGLTLIIFINLPQAALTPWSSMRNLAGLFIAIPAILFPLWENISFLRPFRLVSGVRAIFSGLLLLLVSFSFVLGTHQITHEIPQAQAETASHYALMQELQQLGARHIYTDYNTCNRVAFESEEQITCVVLDERLVLDTNQNTIPTYIQDVENDARALYVFPVLSAQNLILKNLMTNPQVSLRYPHWNNMLFNGYAIYQPEVQ